MKTSSIARLLCLWTQFTAVTAKLGSDVSRARLVQEVSSTEGKECDNFAYTLLIADYDTDVKVVNGTKIPGDAIGIL